MQNPSQADTHQPVVDVILRSGRMPSVPAVALAVLQHAERADADANSLAEIIAQDPALASMVLKTVNSSFYGQARTIATLKQAIVILGLNTVRTVALGFSFVHGFGRAARSRFDHDALWKRSIRTAVTARELASHIPSVDPEEAYLAGLLSRLGILAMSTALSTRYEALFQSSGGIGPRLLAAEMSWFGTTHALTGGELADHWNLPPQISNTMRFLPDPDEAPSDHRVLVRLVTTADHAADLFGDAPARALLNYRRRCREWFGISDADAEQLIDSAEATVEAVWQSLNLSSSKLAPPSEILARANAALTRVTLQVSQESDRLSTENVALANEASTDPLTSLPNRRRLEQLLAEQTPVASPGPPALAILMIDLDRFKQVNDEYGHQVGDLMLQGVATVLRALFQEPDTVVRYGGEEFAVMIPNAALDLAQSTAERARVAIETLEVLTADGERLSVTASIGAAVREPGHPEEAASILQRADVALYSAKGAGRNCVVAVPFERAA